MTLLRQALDDIHNRATFEMMERVLILTNALRNSLQFQLSCDPDERLLGVAGLQGYTVIAGPDAITNASFKALKLPDDIAIPGNYYLII